MNNMAGIFDNLVTLEDTNANTDEPQKDNDAPDETRPQTNEEAPQNAPRDITVGFYSQEFYDYYKRR